jgi:hypothetical protein
MAARLPGLIAAAMVGGVAVLYIAVIRSQGEVHDMTVVAGFASALFVTAVAGLAGSLAHDPYWRRLAFGSAATIAFVCMWLSGLSIGPLLLPAVVLLAFAFGRG